MKKIFMIAALALVTATAGAQNWKAEVGAGVTQYNGDADSDGKFAWQVGAGYEFKVVGNFSIQPYLYLIDKGGKGDGLKSNAYYLEMPVLASYRFDVGHGISVVPQIGPYFSVGIFGKTKEDVYGGNGEKVKYDTFSNDALKNRDIGLTFKVEAEYQKYSFGVRYDMGVTDNNNSDGGSIKNSTWMFSLGYRF